MISLALLLALTTPPQIVQGRPPLQDVVRAVALIHERDWRGVTPDAVAKILALPWERLDVQVPADSKYKTSDCDGSLYLKYESDRYSVSFEFRRSAGRECELSLHSVRVSIGESPSTVAAAHASLLSNLHAAGRVCDEVDRYRWRSDDSGVLFDLRVTTESDPGHAGLALWLTHTRVVPQAVDDLPFRKGYFPPER